MDISQTYTVINYILCISSLMIFMERMSCLYNLQYTCCFKQLSVFSSFQKAMMQFEWHDGTVKNVHVDPPILYDYQVSY